MIKRLYNELDHGDIYLYHDIFLYDPFQHDDFFWFNYIWELNQK